MSVLTLPTCPTTCAGAKPAQSFNECTPELHYGEISKIYYCEADGTAFTNVDQLGEWTTRLDQSSNTADKIRTLVVIGEMLEAEQTEIPISGGRTSYSPKTFTINAEIDETNDTNYEAMLTFECNLKYKIWPETSDGMLYGGNAGIEVVFKSNQPIPKSREEIVKILLSAKWKSKNSPLRCLSPMF